MTEPLDQEDATPSPQRPRWKRVAAAVGRAARAPFDGAGALYRIGQDNLHFTLPVLNGAFGDQLAARHDRRTIQFSFRRYAADIAVADLGLQPATGGRPRTTVVFLHGLMGDEVIWQTGHGPDDLRFGPLLQQDLPEVCCLYVRFNSGLHISENGRRLHELLTELVATYPEAVGELVLVGHSMGGLLIRSAGYYAEEAANASEKLKGENGLASSSEAPVSEHLDTVELALEEPKPTGKKSNPKTKQQAPKTNSWLDRLRDVFLLGVPNDGSFLEQNSHFTSLILRKINLWPTRAISGLLDQRSNGIKDLRHALLVDEDWQSPHADDLFPPRTVVPLLPHVHYHVLVGSLLKSASSALHDYFGDGLVGAGSAAGRIFQDPAAPPGRLISTRVYPQLHHGTLLSNPEVYQYLRERIG
ncbi:esterase/lipase family protein [Hymenobacter lapidiphilus]|uniref:Alpha/beta fold hydrolase n=1 Tax=Hymenobacter lapidiphilus TaxID=2608003 RepID=A0A7Y7PQ57_9BACT|nr:alpha/beta fold hydrolase [Hymenobacter lapidiphilus]NVO31958.1 alpha/beta fold hydrolase [Hymenobacter lapidiphilus]